MSADRIRRLRDLFERACELPPAGRAAFVAAQCSDDTGLADELTGLLEQDVALAHARTLSAVGIADQIGIIEPPTLHDGQQLGPWCVTAEIGRGGMGRVFRARRADGAFDKDVAIKVVRRDLLAPSLLERFSTERAVLGSLEHPNIARLIDAAVTDDGTPYVVMELVDGTDLVSWCNARRIGLRERVALFRKVVDAVEHAHRRLVVHRDIKASNVLVGADGNPKLLDFGLAKPLAGDQAATGTGERFLTPMSAAPEQFRGEPVTVACDVYALGVLLYELLAGRPPFALAGLTPGQVEHLVLSVPPPAMAGVVAADNGAAAREHGCTNLRAWRAQLEGDLEAIVQRALRKEPAARYATTEQLDADLADWLADRPVRARDSQRLYRARKFVARHRGAVAFAALSVLILVATTATIALQNVELALERDRVALERDRAEKVVDLLESSFDAADPTRSGKGNATAADILKAAHGRLATLEDQPQLYARMAQVVARVEVTLGRAPEAADITTKSVNALVGRLSDAELAPLRFSQADALFAAGDFPRAQAALDLAAPYLDRESPEYLLTSAKLISRYGRHTEAIALLELAIARIAARSPDDPLTVSAYWRLAETLRVAGRMPKALAMLERALQWQLAHPDTSATDVLRTRVRLAAALNQVDRLQEGLDLSRRILPDVQAIYGAESHAVAAVRNTMGNSLTGLKRADEAAAEFREALRLYVVVFGADHPDTQAARFNLANLLAERPDGVSEALELLRQCVEVAQRRLPAEARGHTTFRVAYAALLADHDPALALAILADNPGAATIGRTSIEQRDEFFALLKAMYEAAGCATTAGAKAAETAAACDQARPLLANAPEPAAGPSSE